DLVVVDDQVVPTGVPYRGHRRRRARSAAVEVPVHAPGLSAEPQLVAIVARHLERVAVILWEIYLGSIARRPVGVVGRRPLRRIRERGLQQRAVVDMRDRRLAESAAAEDLLGEHRAQRTAQLAAPRPQPIARPWALRAPRAVAVGELESRRGIAVGE